MRLNHVYRCLVLVSVLLFSNYANALNLQPEDFHGDPVPLDCESELRTSDALTHELCIVGSTPYAMTTSADGVANYEFRYRNSQLVQACDLQTFDCYGFDKGKPVLVWNHETGESSLATDFPDLLTRGELLHEHSLGALALFDVYPEPSSGSIARSSLWYLIGGGTLVLILFVLIIRRVRSGKDWETEV